VSADRAEVEAFLFREARLLDERRYAEWEALWTDDGVYWVPAEHGDYDPTRKVSLIFDDRPTLARRIERLTGGDNHAESPAASVCRMVSNVEVMDGTRSNGRGPAGDVVVHSTFMAATARRDTEQLWAGRCTHHLRRVDGELRIAYKRVVLVNCSSFLTHLPFLP
jgi:3-phenylpropionate/cinnamic acid dioxygenase small subunit